MSDTVGFINDWVKSNGTISSGDAAKLSQFMEDLGRHIDNLSVVPANGGTDLILYSGWIGDIPMWKMAESASQSGANYYFISDTEAGKSINGKKLETSLIDACDADEALASQILSGYSSDGLRSPYVIGNHLSINDRVSSNLSKSASGNVSIWAPNGNLNTVLPDTELRQILTNASVTSINGIPKDIFLEEYRIISGNASYVFDRAEDLDSKVVNEIFDSVKKTCDEDYFDSVKVFYNSTDNTIAKIDISSMMGKVPDDVPGTVSVYLGDMKRMAESGLGKSLDNLKPDDIKLIVAALDKVDGLGASRADNAAKLIIGATHKHGDEAYSVIKSLAKGAKGVMSISVVGLAVIGVAVSIGDAADVAAAMAAYDEEDPYTMVSLASEWLEFGSDIAPPFVDLLLQTANEALDKAAGVVSANNTRVNQALNMLDQMIGNYEETDVKAEDLTLGIDELQKELKAIEELQAKLYEDKVLERFKENYDPQWRDYDAFDKFMKSIDERRNEILSAIDYINEHNAAIAEADKNGLFTKEGSEKIKELREEQEGLSTVDLLEKFNEQKDAAKTITSPLVIDLDGNGFFAIGRADGTYFDLNNNGFAEKTAWIGGNDDGFLVLDINNNGIIDNGFELFGNNTMLKSGRLAKDGFEALSDYDTDKDGRIDAGDEIFSRLKVWTDTGNGTSETVELFTLAELGITSIGITQRKPEIVNYIDSYVSGISDVTFSDGRVSTMGDFWFTVSQVDTKFISEAEISEELTALPEVRSMGNAPSLRAAMAMDESGELVRLVRAFAETKNVTEKRSALKQMLYKITGADKVVPGSRGSYIDARDLHVLETLLGGRYSGQGGNPGPNATAALKSIYSDLFNTYYTLLMSNSICDYLKLIYFNETDGELTVNTSLFNSYITLKQSKGDDVGEIITGVGAYLHMIDKNGQNYEKFRDYYLGKSLNNAVYFTFDGTVFAGSDAEDLLVGSGSDDFVVGLAGNDILYGRAGNDEIIGGEGNDTLYDRKMRRLRDVIEARYAA